MSLKAKGEILKNQAGWEGYADLTETKLKIWREWAESLFGGPPGR